MIISIHALREEGDEDVRVSRQRRSISIHALREEGDVLKEAGRVVQKLFLSTPSARRATAALAFLASLCKDFYPRPPRGGRRRAC